MGDITIVQADGAAQKFRLERNATATAEQRLTDAQAQVIEIVRNIVVPNETAPKMTDDQITTYFKLMQLETMSQAPLVCHPKGKTGIDGTRLSDSGTSWSRVGRDASHEL